MRKTAQMIRPPFGNQLGNNAKCTSPQHFHLLAVFICQWKRMKVHQACFLYLPPLDKD